MSDEKIKKRIATEEDFVYCPRLGNSLNKLMSLPENSEGLSDERICRVLSMTQEELDNVYKSAIMKLKMAILNQTMGDDNE